MTPDDDPLLNYGVLIVVVIVGALAVVVAWVL